MDLAKSIAILSDRWRSWRFSRNPIPPDNKDDLGRWGECQAARALQRRGWKILYRNFAPETGGEVDLICRHEEALVFVEVKTRRSEEFGRPSAAVTRKKQRRIIRGAFTWLRMLDRPDVTFRFDIVEVLAEPHATTIRVLEAAYELPDIYRY